MGWALIGTSTIARQYMIGAIRIENDEDILWAVSGTAERAADFAQSHEIPNATGDIADALNDAQVDKVYVSSTNEKHFDQVMAAIAAGKHVLCEKPLATSLDDARAMVDAAEKAGVVFGTNHHLRCAGSHRAIRDLVAQGDIGNILSMRIFHAVHLPKALRGWRLDNPDAGGGVIPDLTVHNADVVRFITGEDPQTVSAQMGVSGMGQGVEDSAMSVWQMPSGAMVMSHESFTHPYSKSGIEVHGTKGSIIATDVLSQDPIGTIECITEAGCATVPFEKHGLYGAAVHQFSAAVSGAGTPAASGLDGLKSLSVACAVRNAAHTGLRQTVGYDFAGRDAHKSAQFGRQSVRQGEFQ